MMFETQCMLARAAAAQNPNEAELRDKALMYAVQAYGCTSNENSIIAVAEAMLKFLRGAEA